ncbi:MAG: hypothetical protein AVDCRST_MAG88-4162, partial [uncultured Thermomicrobiales bacterium]
DRGGRHLWHSPGFRVFQRSGGDGQPVGTGVCYLRSTEQTDGPGTTGPSALPGVDSATRVLERRAERKVARV